jgi:acylphosphatase
MDLHYDIRVSGRVQGVFFRASAKAEAARLSLRGFVRNEDDGSVYAEAEGDRESLDQFVAWCRRGPAHARVDDVRVTERSRVEGYRGFSVR